MLSLLVHALVIFYAVGQAPFHFSATINSWTVIATSHNVTLTYLPSGVSWRSSLIAVSLRVRSAQSWNGCWKNQILRTRMGGASLLQGGRQDRSNIVLDGTVMMPTGHVEFWSFEFRPGSSNASLAFAIRLHNRTGAVLNPTLAERSKCPRIADACYVYGTTEIKLQWTLATRERIVGGGEQYSTVDLNGRHFDIWSTEQGVGRGRRPLTSALNELFICQGGDAHTTYSAVPAFLSSRGYGLVLESPQLINVDFKTASTGLSISFENRGSTQVQVIGSVLGGKDVRSLLSPLTDITGRMLSPPSWMLDGLIVGAEGGHAIVSNKIDKLVNAGVSVVGVWIQDWSGMLSVAGNRVVWWNWQLDEARYPKSWFRQLQSRGIRILTYVNPFVIAAPSADGRAPAVFLEARQHGFLVADRSGDPIMYKSFANDRPYAMVDLFNKDAWEWWRQLLLCNVSMACEQDSQTPLVHGWMHDYGEAFPLNALVQPSASNLHDQKMASDMHNIYSYLSAAAAHAATKNMGDVAFFARSGNLHSPSVVRMFWLGDQLVNFDGCDGLQSAIIGAMSGGMSGWSVTHSDVGGFTMINQVPIPGIKFERSQELLVRWMEAAVFLNSVYRTHPGLSPNTSVQVWDDNMLGVAANLTALFRSLRPYREALLAEGSQTGLPPVRHGLLVYPEDGTWFQRTKRSPLDFLKCPSGNQVGLSQFFWGDNVIVAPVLQADVDEIYVYLPAGEWTHYWTRATFTGPSHRPFPAPLGKPVFFYRVQRGAASRGTWTAFFSDLRPPTDDMLV